MAESEITGFAVSESTFRITHHHHFKNEKRGKLPSLRKHII